MSRFSTPTTPERPGTRALVSPRLCFKKWGRCSRSGIDAGEFGKMKALDRPEHDGSMRDGPGLAETGCCAMYHPTAAGGVTARCALISAMS